MGEDTGYGIIAGNNSSQYWQSDTAIWALKYHQKSICLLRAATGLVCMSGVEANIPCWQIGGRSVQDHRDGWWAWSTWCIKERWREPGFISLEKRHLREDLIADVHCLTGGYQPSLRSAQGCLVLKRLVLSLVARDKRDTLQHGKFWLHIRRKTPSHESGAAPGQGQERWWDLHCGTCSKLSWTRPWPTWPRFEVSWAWRGELEQRHPDVLPHLNLSVILCAKPAALSHVLIMS